MYIYFNGNPCGENTGDCVIRAISIATGFGRHKVYSGLCAFGYPCTIWGNSNSIWGKYLEYLGFKRFVIDSDCTVSEFSKNHAKGTFVLGTGKHAVAVINGNYIDSWDSGKEKIIYYFRKEK